MKKSPPPPSPFPPDNPWSPWAIKWFESIRREKKASEVWSDIRDYALVLPSWDSAPSSLIQLLLEHSAFEEKWDLFEEIWGHHQGQEAKTIPPSWTEQCIHKAYRLHGDFRVYDRLVAMGHHHTLESQWIEWCHNDRLELCAHVLNHWKEEPRAQIKLLHVWDEYLKPAAALKGIRNDHRAQERFAKKWIHHIEQLLRIWPEEPRPYQRWLKACQHYPELAPIALSCIKHAQQDPHWHNHEGCLTWLKSMWMKEERIARALGDVRDLMGSASITWSAAPSVMDGFITKHQGMLSDDGTWVLRHILKNRWYDRSEYGEMIGFFIKQNNLELCDLWFKPLLGEPEELHHIGDLLQARFKKTEYAHSQRGLLVFKKLALNAGSPEIWTKLYHTMHPSQSNKYGASANVKPSSKNWVQWIQLPISQGERVEHAKEFIEGFKSCQLPCPEDLDVKRMFGQMVNEPFYSDLNSAFEEWKLLSLTWYHQSDLNQTTKLPKARRL